MIKEGRDCRVIHPNCSSHGECTKIGEGVYFCLCYEGYSEFDCSVEEKRIETGYSFLIVLLTSVGTLLLIITMIGVLIHFFVWVRKKSNERKELMEGKRGKKSKKKEGETMTTEIRVRSCNTLLEEYINRTRENNGEELIADDVKIVEVPRFPTFVFYLWMLYNHLKIKFLKLCSCCIEIENEDDSEDVSTDEREYDPNLDIDNNSFKDYQREDYLDKIRKNLPDENENNQRVRYGFVSILSISNLSILSDVHLTDRKIKKMNSGNDSSDDSDSEYEIDGELLFELPPDFQVDDIIAQNDFETIPAFKNNELSYSAYGDISKHSSIAKEKESHDAKEREKRESKTKVKRKMGREKIKLKLKMLSKYYGKKKKKNEKKKKKKLLNKGNENEMEIEMEENTNRNEEIIEIEERNNNEDEIIEIEERNNNEDDSTSDDTDENDGVEESEGEYETETETASSSD